MNNFFTSLQFMKLKNCKKTEEGDWQNIKHVFMSHSEENVALSHNRVLNKILCYPELYLLKDSPRTYRLFLDNI